jgi:hypothetical protein
MEKNLNEQQERLQTLLESKAFKALSDDERAFVLTHLSMEEYMLQHTILFESKELHDAYEPRALMLNEKKRGVVIPLYQAIAGVAAAVIISFFIFRSETTTVLPEEKTILAQTDTVYVDKMLIDTVVEYRTRYIERDAQTTYSNEVTSAQIDKTPAVSLSPPVLLQLSSMDLTNKGDAGINDESIGLLNAYFGSN